MSTDGLIADLSAYSEATASYHGDRELADRVLLAAGWRCIPDPGHPAKVRWEFGTNPVYSSWEPNVPHPIQSVDAALGQLPFGWRVFLMKRLYAGGEWKVTILPPDFSPMVHGKHPSLSVAICKAVVLAWERNAR